MSTLFKNSNVVTVTDDDFILSNNPKIRSSLWRPGDEGYLLCFASWCPHCASKVPLWEKLAEETNTNPNTDFIIMAADIDEDSPNLAREANITGVPTLFHVQGDGSMKKIRARQPSEPANHDTTDWSSDDLHSRMPTTSYGVPRKTTKTSTARQAGRAGAARGTRAKTPGRPRKFYD